MNGNNNPLFPLLLPLLDDVNSMLQERGQFVLGNSQANWISSAWIMAPCRVHIAATTTTTATTTAIAARSLARALQAAFSVSGRVAD